MCQRKLISNSRLEHPSGFSLLTFSTFPRVLLQGSQGRPCLCLPRHCSLLSGLGGRRSGVMRRQRTCCVNLGGKCLNIFEKMLLYTFSHLSFYSDSHTLTAGICQSFLRLKGWRLSSPKVKTFHPKSSLNIFPITVSIVTSTAITKKSKSPQL